MVAELGGTNLGNLTSDNVTVELSAQDSAHNVYLTNRTDGKPDGFFDLSSGLTISTTEAYDVTKGEGPDFVRSHDLTHAGDFPQNTSGGQLSCGQAGAAGGFIGMTETIRQLTGQAGARGVADARYGLVGGFGMVTYDRCLCTGAAILEAAA